MSSLKQQLPILIIGPLVLLSIFMTSILGLHMKDRALFATATKAESDLNLGETIIDLWYPGYWDVKGGILYKGDIKISNNNTVVDKIAKLTGDTVTIFLGDVRVSTTVREKSGNRAIGTRASDVVSDKVLKNGQLYLGEAKVLDEFYQTAYKPLRDENGKIIGMFYVGISKKFSDQMTRDSIVQIVMISIGLTVLVSIGAWLFAKRSIIDPIEQITKGTQAVSCGRPCVKVDVATSNEIGELANSFNEMLETMQQLASQLNKKSSTLQARSESVNQPGSNDGEQSTLNSEVLPRNGTSQPLEISEPIQNEGMQVVNGNEDQANLEVDCLTEELPKGLNESTYKQILSYLQNQTSALSAEEVGEGVKLTRVTARRYLEFLEQRGMVMVELKYGTVGRPVKLYAYKDRESY